MKYVIYKKETDCTTMYYPMIIPECVNHNEFVPNKEIDAPKLTLHSAGFFHVVNKLVIVHHEKSESLNIGPSDADTRILSNLLSNSGQWAFITFDEK